MMAEESRVVTKDKTKKGLEKDRKYFTLPTWGVSHWPVPDPKMCSYALLFNDVR